MISDFRSAACPGRIDADLCIVGAGPAGLTLASALADTPWRICLLESGGLRCERDSQALNAGLTVGPHALDAASSRLRVLGGATRVWGGGCIPMSAAEMAPRDWVPDSGWPIGRDELAPWYARANRVCRVQPDDIHDGSYRPPGTARASASPGASLESRICRMSPLDFGQTHLPLLRSAPNLHLVLHANLLGLQASADARSVRQARIGGIDGRRGEVRARCFVLAAGGIENARLLLLSDDVVPGGLGNAHGLVGRYFMDHPRCRLGSFHGGDLERLATLCALPLDHAPSPAHHQLSLCNRTQRDARLLHARFWPFAVERPSPGLQSLRELRASLRLASHDESDEVERALLDALAIDLPTRRQAPAPEAPRVRLVTHATTHAHHVAKAGVRKLSHRPAVATDHVEMVGYFEQAPNRDSRIGLSDQHDVLGLRKVQVDWRLTGQDQQGMRTTCRMVGHDIATRFGCRFEPAPWLLDPEAAPPVQGTAHHMGTTRMADSPAAGVVDRNCRVHGMDNLYIAGSSVFPTGGWSFPTLTIAALALRLGDELRQRLDSLPALPLPL